MDPNPPEYEDVQVPPPESIRILSPRDGGETHPLTFTVEGSHTLPNGAFQLTTGCISAVPVAVAANAHHWSRQFTAANGGPCTATAFSPGALGDSVTFTISGNPDMVFNNPTLTGTDLTVTGLCKLAGVTDVLVTIQRLDVAFTGAERNKQVLVNGVSKEFSATFNMEAAGKYLIGAKAVGGTLMTSKVVTV